MTGNETLLDRPVKASEQSGAGRAGRTLSPAHLCYPLSNMVNLQIRDLSTTDLIAEGLQKVFVHSESRRLLIPLGIDQEAIRQFPKSREGRFFRLLFLVGQK